MNKNYLTFEKKDFVEMNFDEILNIQIKNNEIFPFNLKISGNKNKPDDFSSKCEGPGIYFISEKKNNTLLYIGVHSPENETVYNARYYKHISTFTMRGYRIAKQQKDLEIYNLLKSKNYLKVLQNHLLSKCKGKNAIDEEFLQCLQEAMYKGKEVYKKSVGIQVSLRRVAYANYCWNVFNVKDINLIRQNFKNHFLFHYIKLPYLLEISSKKRERFLFMKKNIETPLINYFKPLVNSDSPNEFDFEEQNFTKFDLEKINEKLNEFIRK